MTDYELRLPSEAELRWMLDGGRPSDGSWAPEYPLDGDRRAGGGYLDRLAGSAAKTETRTETGVFGYYQVIAERMVIGGAGFHGPPILGVVEIGYGIVPSARRRGAATAALRLLIEIARSADVALVTGNAEVDNLASRSVMAAVGMEFDGLAPDPAGQLMAHYSIELT